MNNDPLPNNTDPALQQPEPFEPADDSAPTEQPPQDALSQLEQQCGELLARLQRVTADYQNAQRRFERDLREESARANARFAKTLLPPIDNLERALAAPSTHPESAALATGVKMVLEQFFQAFASAGIRRINQTHVPFDPHIHEALLRQPDQQPPMTVLEIAETGYVMGDLTIRAAKVVVSSGPAQADASRGNDPAAAAVPATASDPVRPSRTQI